MDPKDAKPNASQGGWGKCLFCLGTGRVAGAGKPLPCPRCAGTGTAPKITPK